MGMGKDPVLDDIETLYRTRFANFLRVATAITGSIESGRDAVHDAFLAAVRGRGQYRAEGCIEAWLWRAVVTSALKVRRASNTLLSAPASEAPDQSPNDRRSDDLDEVRAAVARLPERQRLVLFLRYYADLDYRTIASVLNVRPGTVAAALNAAHRTLRRQIEEVPIHD
jgi:RNA polymerase sigma-70 factor (ECF subfamily)